MSFGAIGVVNTLIDYSMFLLGYYVLGLPLVPANILSWLVAVSGSYVMNSFITFAAESGRQLRWRDYGTFVVSGVAGLIVAIGITADSFVVFFERLRDEVREGKQLRRAVEAGWKRARRTIIVSDTVSFIAAHWKLILEILTAPFLGATLFIDGGMTLYPAFARGG